MTYTIQVHGEWSGREDVPDLDFKADTLAEAEKLIDAEVSAGVTYLLTTQTTSLFARV